jgi:hypothetical protein
MAVERRTHVARFVDGPRDREAVVVPALESGEPPEVVLTPGRPDWVYVRAGAQGRDGSLPYLYMPPSRLTWSSRSQQRKSVGLTGG